MALAPCEWARLRIGPRGPAAGCTPRGRPSNYGAFRGGLQTAQSKLTVI